MISFFIKKVSNKIFRNAFVYFLLALQVAIGCAFFGFSMNHFLSTKNVEDYYQKRYTETVGTLEVFKNDPAQVGISFHDLLYIQSIFPEANIHFRAKSMFFVQEDDAIPTYYLMFTNDPLFNFSEPCAYAGADVLAVMERLGVVHDINSTIVLQNGILTLPDINTQLPVYEITWEMGTQKEPFFPADGIESGLDYSKTLFLPASLLTNDFRASVLYDDVSFETKGIEHLDEKLGEVLSSLAQKHPGIQYDYSYPLLTMNNFLKDLTFTSKALGMLGTILLIELTIGFSGVVILFIQKRKKELAICSAVGAPKSILIAEILLEVGVIYCIGGIGGILGGIFLTETNSIQNSVVAIKNQGISVLIVVIICLLCTFITSFPLIIKIAKLNVDDILREV